MSSCLTRPPFSFFRSVSPSLREMAALCIPSIARSPGRSLDVLHRRLHPALLLRVAHRARLDLESVALGALGVGTLHLGVVVARAGDRALGIVDGQAPRHAVEPLERPAVTPDAREIADQLLAREVKLALGPTTYDPTDPMGKMFFNILATFAEFESDLIRMRTREGMAVARAKGKLRGKKPKLSDRQARELRRMYDTGDYSVSDLAEVFSVSRPTVYRTLHRQPAAT